MGPDPQGLMTMASTVHFIGRTLLDDSNSTSSTSSAFGMSTKFNPSMAIIIIVLISAFFFMGFFSLYVRKCTHSSQQANPNNNAQARQASPMPMGGQGLDRALVESLPLVGYSIVKGLKEAKDSSECAVCLSEFEVDETLRLLPECGHLFHPECIDMWFYSHSTCPLCRCSLVPSGDSCKESHGYSEEFANWVASRGLADAVIITVNGENGLPVHELVTPGMDPGAGTRVDPAVPGVAVGSDDQRVGELRALNRALSRNSQSFRKAARTMEAGERLGLLGSESARYNPSPGGPALFPSGGKFAAMSISFDKRSTAEAIAEDVAFRRSSSVGSADIYRSDLLGRVFDDSFAPELSDHRMKIDRAQLLTEHRIRSGKSSYKKQWSGKELRALVSCPGDDKKDEVAKVNELMAAVDAAGDAAPSFMGLPPLRRKTSQSSRSGELPRTRSRSGELPRVLPAQERRNTAVEEANAVLGARAESTSDSRARSDRWNLSETLRNTFSLKRSGSVGSELTESLNNAAPSTADNNRPSSSISTLWPSASRVKRNSPWSSSAIERRDAAVEDGEQGGIGLHQIVTDP